MARVVCVGLTVLKKTKNKRQMIFTFSPFTPLQSHLDKDVHPWQAFKEKRIEVFNQHKTVYKS